MSNIDTTATTNDAVVDDLADLGLSLDATAPVENQAAVDAEPVVATPAPEKQTRKSVTLGEVSVSEEAEELEDIKRGGGGGARESKYDFSDIKAPVSKGVVDGEERFAYFSKTYRPGEGTEAEELDRSVKSAATGANRQGRKDGKPERYVTRAVTENGKHVATKVIRVDGTTGMDDKEDKAKA